jgi:hypothetical protein
VPYYAWDNRPASDPKQDWMTVWVRRSGSEKARQVLDQNDRKDWQHSLYRPVPE